MKTVEDILLDADDALVDFLNECEIGSYEAEEGSRFFVEGFNRGVEAMREQVLTMLEKQRV